MEVHILTHPRANRDTQCYYKSLCVYNIYIYPRPWIDVSIIQYSGIGRLSISGFHSQDNSKPTEAMVTKFGMHHALEAS